MKNIQETHAPSFAQSNVPKKFEPKTETLIAGIKAVTDLGNISCLVVDFSNRQVIFQSQTLLYIGNDPADGAGRSCVNPYWSYVPDGIVELLLLLKRNGLQTARKFPLTDYKTHICTTDFPIIIGGKKIFIHQKFKPLMLGPDGEITLGLFLISSSACEEIESYIETESGLILKYNFKNNQYVKCKERFHLTKTEKTIVACLTKKMKTEDISKELGMSVNTVRKHRRNIYAKLDAHSKDDVIVIANNYHLI